MAEKTPAKASKADGLRAMREERFAKNHPEPKARKSPKKSKKAKRP